MTSTDLWDPRETEEWRPRCRLSLPDWAEKYRYLDPRDASEPGLWRNDRTPYALGPMESFADPRVRVLVLMCGTQLIKTEFINNAILYTIDEDPGPSLFVTGTDDLAKRYAGKRLRRAIDACPTVSSRLLKDNLLDKHFDRMDLRLTGAGSTANLAADPIRFLFVDEVDEFQAYSQAHPLDLALERLKTFWDSKAIICGSPTTRHGRIYREFQDTDKCSFWVPCPSCKKLQTLTFSGIKWPEDVRDPRRIKKERLATYQCKHCQHGITDRSKPGMLRYGRWIPEGLGPNDPVPSVERKGFCLSSIYSPWLTFSDVAARFLSAKDDPEKLRAVVNGWFAEPWEHKQKDPAEASPINSCLREYPPMTVPNGVQVLTAGVDIQADCFYIVVRGWATDEVSSLVLQRRVKSEAELVSLLTTEYHFSDDPKHGLRIRLACVDSGYAASDAYRFCRENAACVPIKGKDSLGGIPYRTSNLDKMPDGRAIPGGLRLYLLDTFYLKSKLARLREVGKWMAYLDVSQSYKDQVDSEQIVILKGKETWDLKPGHKANHYWDVEVYAMAAAEILRVDRLDAPVPVETPKGIFKDDEFEDVGKPGQSPLSSKDAWMKSTLRRWR